MPCWTATMATVNLKVADLDLLEAAFKEMNLNPVRQGEVIYFGQRGESFNKSTGELRVRSEQSVAPIKRAYSRQIVKKAERYGWKVVDKGQGKFELLKR